MREMFKKWMAKTVSKGEKAESPLQESEQLRFKFSMIEKMQERINEEIKGLLSSKGEYGRTKYISNGDVSGLKEYIKEALNTPKYSKIIQKYLKSYGAPQVIEVYQLVSKDNPFEKDVFVASLSESFFLGHGKIGKIRIPLQNIIGIGDVSRQEVIVKKEKDDDDEEE